MPPAPASISDHIWRLVHQLFLHGTWRRASVVGRLGERHSDPTEHLWSHNNPDVDVHVSYKHSRGLRGLRRRVTRTRLCDSEGNMSSRHTRNVVYI